ncbi:MAG: DUF4190 domain-containing protein [Chloroflexi bacterium]|nr:MAG: DUF4190 domain-containing protein [Chloroflexota bacterium]
MSSTPGQVPPPPPGASPAQLGGYSAPAAPTNTLAVVSLVASVGSFVAHVIPVIGGVTVALIAIVTGFMARGQIKQSGEQGMWMANLGIVIGFVHLALVFVGIVILLIFVFVLGVALFGIAAHGGATPSPQPTG